MRCAKANPPASAARCRPPFAKGAMNAAPVEHEAGAHQPPLQKGAITRAAGDGGFAVREEFAARAAGDGTSAVREHPTPHGLRLSAVAALLALLAACSAPAPPPQTAAPQAGSPAPVATPPAAAPANDAVAAAVGACNAQAQMIYAQVGGRLRGRSVEQQMEGYAAQLGPQSPQLAGIRAQLDKLYAAPENALPELGAAVAAECLAATPALGIDAARALACYRQHQHPLQQRLYVDETPPGGEAARSADQAQLRCLRGETV